MGRFVVVLVLVLLLVGCTWTPKTVLPKYFRSIHIPKFGNETLEPQLVEVITRLAIEKFELDGRLTVTEHVSKADGIVFGNIVKYKKVPLSYTETG